MARVSLPWHLRPEEWTSHQLQLALDQLDPDYFPGLYAHIARVLWARREAAA